MADSERHCIFLVKVTKMYSDGRYLPQISLPFHQVFFTVWYWGTVLRIIANLWLVKIFSLLLVLCNFVLANHLEMSSCGDEAAFHAMRDAFWDDDTEGMLLIDATDAFNSLNRAIALYSIQHLCPLFSTSLINTYRYPACLYVDGMFFILRGRVYSRWPPCNAILCSCKCTLNSEIDCPCHSGVVCKWCCNLW